MYSSSYSRAKFGLEAREPLHRHRGKSCGYYMRIIFFFSSLIQSLIIVSLVLFLIYGQPEKSAAEKRVKELELSFNRLSEKHIQLGKEKGDLGAQLGARTAEKAELEKEMAKLKAAANKTEQELRNKLATCEKVSATTLAMMTRRPTPPIQPPLVTTSSELKTLQSLNAQQRAMISLINSNFTQTVQYLSQERDNALRDRDTLHQDGITLRRENVMLKEQLATYTRKCKEDFAHSLDGIKMVTRDFLNRINNLFPHQLTFHLTCDSQQEQMEKIRNSCTNLSRDVENKFQLYLDNVGNKVAEIQALSSRLEVQNSHVTANLKQCEQDLSETIAKNAKLLELKQKTHDDQMEKVLLAQNQLRDQQKLQEERLALKDKEVQRLQGMLSSLKPSLPKPAALRAAPQPDRQTAPNWPSAGAPGISKTLTVR
ncbi:plasmalemma vesicle associated protein b [Stegastes partitus]|uniref:Plasmalemma vesicle-associated protein n=1 Tax=Stegastes partitus TaxID=144197 RepID=A0A3B4ZC11_9TELE|nr:PREDICTED: plasmalemma vesicle-associated protein [Stegastes partitus]